MAPMSAPHASTLLADAARRAAAYLDGLDRRSVAPSPDALAALDALDVPLPESGADPAAVLMHERTRRVIAALQADGTCWCGGTVWQGRTAMRISVSSWATTEDDVERSLAAMLRLARS